MTTLDQIKGKVAIVTGGGRGLGRSMALGLARAGARVAITAACKRDEIDAVAKEGGGNILPLAADVTKLDDCQRVVRATEEAFGPIDILVNNAGRGMRFVSERFMTEPTRFWETDPEIWRTVIDTNVNGPFLMARTVVPGMIRRGRGRVINVSMNQDTMRRRGFTPYGPSKAALESATIIWAQELADTGVTMNAILPGGATRTGMVPDDVDAAIKAKLLDPDVMIAPLLWLVSDAAAKVNGRRINAALWNDADPLAAAEEPAGWIRPG